MAEDMKDFYELAKDIADAEKSVGIERWVKVSIEREIGGDSQNRETLHVYDIPVRMKERYEWVFRWRRARFQCAHPKDIIIQTLLYYKKVSGYDIGMQKELDTFVAAKAQFTKQQRKVNQYREWMRSQNDMFYNEDNDKQLQMALDKLREKEENIQKAEMRLKDKVKQYIEQYETKRKRID